jgi:hypothetical protein
MSADGNPFHYWVVYLPEVLMKNMSSEVVADGDANYFRNNVTEDREVVLFLHSIFLLIVLTHRK